ncbi:MAG: POSSIBLE OXIDOREDUCTASE [uncultured Acidimicrobiales bacterium]|uniref:POSSIBLE OXIDOREDUCTASE n=1 Tax=uncultured Acidimicrobiales bacterium TaxID=310071 RepID=A0A6J4H7B2_9ACTN|nr:MAG: POSSIBLE OXIDOREDUCTASE [uncultured Acidimicrobiales bacterium]
MALKIGVQLHPQATTTDALRAAWRAVDQAGADSIWVWDHFYPLYGDPDAAHFECYTLLAAMAVETSRAAFGAMVTCNSYRNPELLADMARTVDHLSGGRFILGIGSGWFERDYAEYGYDFGTASSRLKDLAAALPRIKDRLAKLKPPPVQQPLPLLIGGGGEKVTLRLVAEHATMWNAFGTPAEYQRKSRILDEWCTKVGRDPAGIERTINIKAGEVGRLEEYEAVGVQHVILGLGHPFDLAPLHAALERRG